MNCNRLIYAAVIVYVSTITAFAQNTDKSEARQLVEETTPQAKAQLAKREAQAAYQEAVADCRKMAGAERNTCMQEAKKQLQSDLAEARQKPASD